MTSGEQLSARGRDEVYEEARTIAFGLSPAVISFGYAPDEGSFVITLDRASDQPVEVPRKLLGIDVVVKRSTMPHIPADPFA